MVAKALVIPALFGLIATGGCSSPAAPPVNPQSSLPEARPASGNPVSKYIKHVVVIIQENRSLENFFAGYPGANAPMHGCAPTGTRERRFTSGSGCPSGDKEVPLHAIAFDGPDLKHDWISSITDWDGGKMDGFYKYGEHHGIYEAYAYVRRSLIKPYWDMAEQYVLADEMFPDGVWRQLHRASDARCRYRRPHSVYTAEVDFPTEPPDDCDSPPGTKSSYVDSKRHIHRSRGAISMFRSVEDDGARPR